MGNWKYQAGISTPTILYIAVDGMSANNINSLFFVLFFQKYSNNHDNLLHIGILYSNGFANQFDYILDIFYFTQDIANHPGETLKKIQYNKPRISFNKHFINPTPWEKPWE